MNMDKEDWEVYMKMLKENEEQRLSFNERQKMERLFTSKVLKEMDPEEVKQVLNMNKY